ncbi:hypothetical protein ACFC1T_09380 [Kitasatospora sp. NPDC056076]|uniref:hypothetical protein n=1 Tax=Kitasatospora sp. NPDC056076 TaxID=3345703 RepID=UPI0035E3A183
MSVTIVITCNHREKGGKCASSVVLPEPCFTLDVARRLTGDGWLVLDKAPLQTYCPIHRSRHQAAPPATHEEPPLW